MLLHKISKNHTKNHSGLLQTPACDRKICFLKCWGLHSKPPQLFQLLSCRHTHLCLQNSAGSWHLSSKYASHGRAFSRSLFSVRSDGHRPALRVVLVYVPLLVEIDKAQQQPVEGTAGGDLHVHGHKEGQEEEHSANECHHFRVGQVASAARCHR